MSCGIPWESDFLMRPYNGASEERARSEDIFEQRAVYCVPVWADSVGTHKHTLGVEATDLPGFFPLSRHPQLVSSPSLPPPSHSVELSKSSLLGR